VLGTAFFKSCLLMQRTRDRGGSEGPNGRAGGPNGVRIEGHVPPPRNSFTAESVARNLIRFRFLGIVQRTRTRRVVTIPIKPTSLGDPLARSIRSRRRRRRSFAAPRIIYEDVSKRRPGRLFPSPSPLVMSRLLPFQRASPPRAASADDCTGLATIQQGVDSRPRTHQAFPEYLSVPSAYGRDE